MLNDELDKLQLPEDADVPDVLVSGASFEFLWDDDTEENNMNYADMAERGRRIAAEKFPGVLVPPQNCTHSRNQ